MLKVSKGFLFALTLVVGLAVFVLIPIFVGVDATLAILGKIGLLGIILFCVNGFLIHVMPAAGWKILLHQQGKRVPFFSLLKANFMGYPVTFLMPSAYLGGEPVKLYYIAQTYQLSKREILATMITSKFQELSGIVLVCLAATMLILFQSNTMSLHGKLLMLAGVSFLALLLGGLLYAFLGNLKPTVKVLNFLARLKIFPEKMEKLRSKAEEVEELVRESFTKHWKAFLLSQCVTLFSAFSVFVRPLIFFLFYHPAFEITLSVLAIIFVLTQLLMIFHLVPGGFGIFDGGMVGIFALALGSKGAEVEGAAFTILTRISDFSMVFIGLWLISHYGLTRMVKEAVTHATGNSSPNVPA